MISQVLSAEFERQYMFESCVNSHDDAMLNAREYIAGIAEEMGMSWQFNDSNFEVEVEFVDNS